MPKKHIEKKLGRIILIYKIINLFLHLKFIDY